MKTSTKIIIGVAALATIGVGGFLVYRHFKKKNESAEIPQDNTYTPTTYTPTETPTSAEPSPSAAPAQSTSKPTATSSGSSSTSTEESKRVTMLQKMIGNNAVAVDYSYNISAKTVTVTTRVSDGKNIQKKAQTFKLAGADIAAVQRYIVQVLPKSETEMKNNRKGRADDGVFGKITAKWFAALILEAFLKNNSAISSKLKELGVKGVL